MFLGNAYTAVDIFPALGPPGEPENHPARTTLATNEGRRAPHTSEPSTASTTPIRLVLAGDLGDQLDLDGRAERQFRDAHRRPRVVSGRAKISPMRSEAPFSTPADR